MKEKLTVTQICNIVCVLLMLALVVCHFLPFWNIGGQDYSVWEYVGFPLDNKDVTKYFEDAIDGFTVNDMALMPSAAILLAAVCVVFVFKSSEEMWLGLFPALVGGLGIHAYLTVAAFQMGNMWILPLVISILMLVVAVVGIAFWFKTNKKPGAK